ncbi:regulatory protein RecX [Roseibium aggregatum]|uniref:Regulatory protein RecX n=1 Tax=Roseibium aggregatum TaxID=187304 RepID=A0A926S5V4_9HYPH|nr:RecX family transcriptional regulator [Roseibium aggregatum]MBD1545797.1 RecX family transcriptional regulator [Roseibium aggregatum]
MVEQAKPTDETDGRSGRRDRGAQRKYRLPTEDRLTRAAIHYLDRYSSSLENLRKVLTRKVKRAATANGRAPEEFREIVDQVVEKCRRAGMVDDRTYAETKLAGLRRRGRSKRQIEATLASKGVDRDLIATVVDQDNTSDLEAAQTYARRRKLGPWRTRGQREERREKDMAALCRAGYSYDIARKVIDAADDGEATSAAV